MATVPELDPAAVAELGDAAARERPARGQGLRRRRARRARRAVRRGPRADRGLPRGRQDGPRPRPRPLARRRVRPGPVHRRPAAGGHRRHQRLQPAREPLRVPSRARSSPTSSSSTRSTAPRRRRSRACSSACRSATSPSTATSTSWRARSSSSRPRTRPSTRAPIRCPRRSSTGSWSASRSATRAPARRPRCSPSTRRHDRVHDLEPVTEVGTVRAAQAAVTGGPRQRGAARATPSRSARRPAPTPRVELGASPRAVLMLFRAAKALAALDGRDHVLPDDVQALAPSVLAHRLLLAPGAVRGRRGRRSIGDALERVPALCRSAMVRRADRGGRSASRCCSPGLGFDSPSLLVPGVGLLGLAAVAVAWVELARPAAARARAGPGADRRGRALPAADRALGARLPPPGGELTDRCSPRRSRSARARSGRVDARSRLQRPRAGAGSGPARLEVRDPLGLRSRARRERRPPASCSSCRGSSRCSPPGAAPAGPARASWPGSRTARRRAASTPARSSSRWTGCAPTGRAARRRGSTGRRSRGPASWSSAGWSPAPTRRRWSSSTPPPRTATEALDAAVRAAASLCVHLAGAGGCARAAARAIAARPRSRRTCAPGRRCTPGSRWSRPAGARPRRPGDALRRGLLGHRAAPARRCRRRLRGASGEPRYLVAPGGLARHAARSRSRSPAARGGAIGRARRVAAAARRRVTAPRTRARPPLGDRARAGPVRGARRLRRSRSGRAWSPTRRVAQLRRARRSSPPPAARAGRVARAARRARAEPHRRRGARPARGPRGARGRRAPGAAARSRQLGRAGRQLSPGSPGSRTTSCPTTAATWTRLDAAARRPAAARRSPRRWPSGPPDRRGRRRRRWSPSWSRSTGSRSRSTRPARSSLWGVPCCCSAPPGSGCPAAPARRAARCGDRRRGGALALPVGGRARARPAPLVDYESWELFGAEQRGHLQLEPHLRPARLAPARARPCSR